MQKRGVPVSISILGSLLQDCINKADLVAGREVHASVLANGFESNTFLGNNLIRMFAVCGSLLEANLVFSSLPAPNVYAWSALISAHTKLGQSKQALQLYHQMRYLSVEPDGYVMVAVLKACTDMVSLTQGKLIHVQVLKNGAELEVIVGNTLIDMYAKCGSLEDAHEVFDKLPNRSVVTWTAVIAAHAQHGHGQKALQLFREMQAEGMVPDTITFVSTLKACTDVAALDYGKLIHSIILDLGFKLPGIVGNTLIYMYVKCGSLADAYCVFDALQRRTVVTWNAMIAGYAQHGQCKKALHFFYNMQNEGLEPNNVTRNAMIAGLAQHGQGLEALTVFEQMQREAIEVDDVLFVSILKACTGIGALAQGRLIHAQIIERGCEVDAIVANTLIDMYSKCGNIEDGRRVFEQLRKRSVVTWTSMLAGYVQESYVREAFLLFQQMQQEGMGPSNVTFVSILKLCCCKADLDHGKLIHVHILENGFESDLSVSNTLVDMYMKSECVEDAQKVFDGASLKDVVTWSAMIAGYADHGYGQKALQLFKQMQREGLQPNNLTWNAAISGCSQHGDIEEALCLFQKMQWKGLEPDEVTFINILKAYSVTAALEQGKCIHAFVIESGFDLFKSVSNGLINMYAKCGSLEDAKRVFDRLVQRDILTWNVMIAGYAHHSEYDFALQCFYSMQREGLMPDNVTFISLLSVCSHVGLVNEGCHQFESMKAYYGIPPTVDHYNCMVDLLGRVGCINEAESLLQTMPLQPNSTGWTCLLSHCRKHSNVDLGRRCFDQIVIMDHRDASGHVLMSNIYADAGLWLYVDESEEQRRCTHAWKKPGKAFVEVDNMVQGFLVGDKAHLQIDDMNTKITRLSVQMKQGDYIPKLDLILQPTLIAL